MTISESLSRLAIARGGELDDITGEVYLEGLSDLSPEFIARACSELGKTARGLYETVLPPLGDIRAKVRELEQADRAEQERRLMLPAPQGDDDPRTWMVCTRCEDCGWIIRECPGGEARTCGRSNAAGFHDGIFYGVCRVRHTFAERCECAARNPKLIANRRQGAA